MPIRAPPSKKEDQIKISFTWRPPLSLYLPKSACTYDCDDHGYDDDDVDGGYDDADGDDNDDGGKNNEHKQ